MVNCVCKQTLSECLKQFFHCGARGYSKAYAQRTLAIFEPYKLPFAGSNPAVPLQNVSPAVWFCPSGRKNGTQKVTFVCENVFIQTFVIIRQSEKCFGTPHRAMQNQALPENGYRVIPNSAKRFLSALCRRHLNFQPLLLHE